MTDFNTRLGLVNQLFEVDRVAIKLAYMDWHDDGFQEKLDEMFARMRAIREQIWRLGNDDTGTHQPADRVATAS